MPRDRSLTDGRDEEGWGADVPAILEVLADEGLRLELRNGKLVVTGSAEAIDNPHLRQVIRARRYDLQAWLAGDRTLGVRRLDDQGTLAWRARDPGEPRQRIARL